MEAQTISTLQYSEQKNHGTKHQKVVYGLTEPIQMGSYHLQIVGLNGEFITH
jgi:hypothetical protein